MSAFESCPSCGGFLPHAAESCPHCDAAVEVRKVSFVDSSVAKRLARGLLAVTSGGMLAVTLMACYGAPDCTEETDADGDGYTTEGFCGIADCDDDNADIYPGAEETDGDGVDSNCDGVDGVAEEGGADAGS